MITNIKINEVKWPVISVTCVCLSLTLLVIQISVRSVSGIQETEKDTASWTWKMQLPNVRAIVQHSAHAADRKKIQKDSDVLWSVAWWWSYVAWKHCACCELSVLITPMHLCNVMAFASAFLYWTGQQKGSAIDLFELGSLLLYHTHWSQTSHWTTSHW